MAISFDYATSEPDAPEANPDFSAVHVMGVGPQPYLVAFILSYNGALGHFPTAVTWGPRSQAMSLLGSVYRASDNAMRVWLYGLAYPDAGSYTVSCTFNITVESSEIATASYFGVAGPGAFVSVTAGDDHANLSVPCQFGDWIVTTGDVNGGVVTPAYPHRIRWTSPDIPSQDGTDIFAESLLTVASWSWVSVRDFLFCAVPLRPYGVVSPAAWRAA